MKLLYLDSSAIVKLVAREPETEALFALLPDWPERATSVLAHAEVTRAARLAGDGAIERAGEALAGIGLVYVDEAVLDIAARLEPASLGTLGAIHIATALSIGEDLGAMVAYDEHTAEAAEAAGIKVLAPAG